VATAYRRALQAHGAQVVDLTPDGPRPKLRDLHGLLLSGGPDLHPSHYGQRPHPKLGRVDAARDKWELDLARQALARGLPLLAICRGAQVLGVAAGGRLLQDIASQVPRPQQHLAPSGRPPARHWVRVHQPSRLRAIISAPRAQVNSSHHQANHSLGPGMQAVAWSEDGVIEAVEKNGDGFVIGVQWHPERMWRRAPRQRRLFAAFIGAARQYARRRPTSVKG
jgi:putative glutamine amidotransferase